MASESHDQNRAGRPLRKQGEEAIGRFAQDLLQNPVVTGALTTVFETRERATRAQEVAMSALNLPSAADLERLTRRVRSVAQRIEGLEDGIDRLSDKLEDTVSGLSDKLDAGTASVSTHVSESLAGTGLSAQVSALQETLDTRVTALEEKLDTRFAALEAKLAAVTELLERAPAAAAPEKPDTPAFTDAEAVEAAAEPESGDAEPES